ncbi:MAG TPA: polyprenyl synthetase family protein [Bacteroidales bacterium]|nr:polyprenyl synthetase family protein [Bacteroidales bacterium]
MYNKSQLKEIIEKAISGLRYETEAEKLTEPVKYVLSIGGKRVRPLLTLMTCNLFSDKIDEAIMPATGIEVFHNFTLVHDDIMDNAPVRRGLPTVFKKWDLNQAVLSGDVMAFIANDCFLQAPANSISSVLRIYNKAAIEVCMGQQQDMDFETATAITQDAYLRMIELKTAVLIASAARIGAVIGGAMDQDSDLIYEFGRSLGLAFQLQDDLLDVYGDYKVFGKIQGGDILANKKTYLYVIASEKANKVQLNKLRKLFTTKEIDPDKKVREVMGLYDELNIKDPAESLIRKYFDKAFECLDNTAVHAGRKDELTAMASSLIGRGN